MVRLLSRVPVQIPRVLRRAAAWPPGLWLAVFILVVGIPATLSLNIVEEGFSIKGDEATYVMMALSAADDGDLKYENVDLERFWRLYHRGPEGLFLKRGQDVHLKWRKNWPFVRMQQTPEPPDAPYYFGKAFPHALVAAPFVRLFGLNGILLLNLLLLVTVYVLGYLFLAARGHPTGAFVLSAAFLGASTAPIWAVWLTPEVFNFALVFIAYFLFFYKEVASPPPGGKRRWLFGLTSDLLGAALLAVATFSKVLNLLLIAPPLLLLLTRRRVWASLSVGTCFGVVLVGCFAINLAICGDLNYQGGDRKTFYGRFPLESSDARFDNLGNNMSTNDAAVDERPEPDTTWPQLKLNAFYFVFGRHSGLLLYFFPAVVILALVVAAPRRQHAWQWFTLASLAASVLVTLLLLPFSWSGGGGPPGNRYFLSLYATVLFLVPPLTGVLPGAIAWIGGALFTAHLIMNPFYASKYVWENTQSAIFRLFPVELTMVNDLPVMLNTMRARVLYREKPTLLLYHLDDNSFTPEPAGMWIAGASKAEIIVRCDEPLEGFKVTLHSPIANRATLGMGGPSVTVTLEPGRLAEVFLPARGVHSKWSDAYLFVASCERGFIPHLRDSSSKDNRFLGVQINLEPVVKK
jgi:hypothetical protein